MACVEFGSLEQKVVEKLNLEMCFQFNLNFFFAKFNLIFFSN